MAKWKTLLTLIKLEAFRSSQLAQAIEILRFINPFALRKAKIAHNFGLSECNRAKEMGTHSGEAIFHLCLPSQSE